ncbi:helix-turn-helix domain-containing protein [Curtobacterium flaccumfaciens pv. flaccumfaciens]|uniref:AraC family transcriptional regulator n=1 Tax=Curtobacterium flaccumfaciens TaxID=2035 RepID=UPI0021B0E12F|nr:AraC family transcriptional regulator [Curtobacterium flaccumfaciens]QYI98158.1 helix-turn-helix domain-containing protein [Curtobacterium flaccumfaciens pv. flaccumfaciens]
MTDTTESQAPAPGSDPAARPAQPRSLVAVAGQDTDEAISSLAGMYAGKAWYSRALDHDYWFKYVGVGDERLSVRRSQMHGYLRGDVATEGEVVVQWLERGEARVDVGRDEVRMQPGVPTLFPVERRFEMEYQDWDQRLVHLRRDLVLDVAAEDHLVDGTMAFDTTAAPNLTAVGLWRTAVSGALRALREEGDESLAWHEAQRDVARALFRMYPLQAERFPAGYGTRSDGRLRAAVEFIQAHAHEPLTVADIAQAAGLSIRGIQESFQRAFERSPMTYLREVRLGRVHEELRILDPQATSVADVARRWGFAHMGRFASVYANRFGEYPRDTLRR